MGPKQISYDNAAEHDVCDVEAHMGKDVALRFSDFILESDYLDDKFPEVTILTFSVPPGGIYWIGGKIYQTKSE